MSALDDVLEAYRDMFGVKSDRANETHRLACIEVWNLREAAQQKDAPDAAKAEPYFDPELPEEYIEGVIYYQNRRAGKA